MQEPNTPGEIEFKPRGERRRHQFPLSRWAADPEGPLARARGVAGRLRGQLALVAAAFLGLLLFATLPGIASAHHATLTGQAACVGTDGTWKITWTLTSGDVPSGVHIVDVNIEISDGGIAPDLTEGSFSGFDGNGNETGTATTTYAPNQNPNSTIQASGTVKWSNNVTVNVSAQVNELTNCEPNESTFKVYKEYKGGDGPAVTIIPSCTGGGVISPPTAQADEGSPAVFTVTGMTSNGVCTAVEQPVPTGYVITDNTCDPPGVNLGKDGDTESCKITNSKQPTITVTKACPTGASGTFPITGAGSITSINCGQTLGPVSVEKGSYNVQEGTPPAGWQATPQYSGTCSDSDLKYGESLNCTITNSLLPTLTINKVCSVTDTTTTFTINTSGGQTSVPQQNLKCGGSSGAIIVIPGTYTVAEQAIAGWTTTYGGDCNAQGQVSPANGANKVCTVTNTRDLGALKVIKACTPEGTTGGSFTFQLQNGSGVAVPGVETKQADCGGYVIFSDIPTGTYGVGETVVATGFSLGTNGCSDISVTKGATAQCTVTNTRDIGALKVIKACQPDGTQGGPFTFQLQDSNGTPVPSVSTQNANCGGYVTFTNLPTGNYDVAETSIPGTFSLKTNGCDNVAVAKDATAECTIVNELNSGKVTVEKSYSEANGATPAVEITLSCPGATITPDGTEMATPGGPNAMFTVTGMGVNGVECTVSELAEDVPAGYNFGTIACSGVDGITYEGNSAKFTVKDGDNVSCTVRNVPEKGKLTIVKNATPSAGSPSFAFTGDLGGFNLSHGGSKSEMVVVGDYDITETPLPANWLLADIVCTKVGGGAVAYSRGGDTLYVTVADGSDITCTFYNELKGSITVKKVCTPASELKLSEDFEFSISNNGPQSVDMDCDEGYGPYYLPEGSYTVSEALNGSQYTLGSIVCSGADGASGATVILDNGDAVTCTITNVPYGEVIVLKHCLPEADNKDTFVFDLNGELEFNESTCNSEAVSLIVPAGTYDLNETPDGGNTYVYLSSDISGAGCSGSDGDFQVVVEAGKSVTCSVTNDPMGIITALKACGENSGTDLFTFVLMQGATEIESVTDVDCNQTVVFDNIPALANGTYIGWSETDNDCEGLEPEQSGEVNEAEAECTITNGLADPSVGKVANDDDLSVASGSQFTYTVEVMNDGDGPGDFLLEDYDLVGATIVSVTEAYDNVTCDFTVGGTSFDCEILDLGGGEYVDITVTVLANSTCEPVNNSARVFFLRTEGEGEPEDSIQAQQVEVTGCTHDIELVKGQRIGSGGAFTTSTLEVDVGTNVQYRIVIENTGNQPLTNVTIEDPISGDLTLLDIVSDPDNRCDIVAGDLQCDGFGLNPGATYTVIIEVEVEDCDLITNRAFGDSSETTEQPSNAVQLDCEEEEDDETPTPTPTPTSTPTGQVSGTQTQPQQPQPQPRISEVLPSRLPATGTGDSLDQGSPFVTYALLGAIATVLALLGLALAARKRLARQR
jgi:uncharacterized repeat protein (TIGR01451 family)